MDCLKIKKLLPLYSDQGLEPNQEQEVRDHLKGCPACRKEAEAFERSWAMLDGIDEIQPEPGFVGRFWTRLSLEQPWYERFLGEIQENFFKKKLVPAFVTACLLVVMGSLVLNHYSQVRQTDRLLTGLSEEDLKMVENIELAKNLDFIKDLDLLEDLDVIANLDSSET